MNQIKMFNLHTLKLTKDDFLLVIDMQKDFIPPNPCGVIGGDQIINQICDLIDQFSYNKSHIILTRDYHPPNHVSLIPNGSFDKHCLWGSTGSQICPQIVKRCTGAGAGADKIHVVFKAIHQFSDSYGALPYQSDYMYHRFGINDTRWTGSLMIQQPMLIDALTGYPEQTANFSLISEIESLDQFSRQINSMTLTQYLYHHVTPLSNFYLCGLAGDYCVLDTSINLHNLYPNNSIRIIEDCVRYLT